MADKLIARIEKLEDKALLLGDLKTAIKLNWLRNSLKYDGIDCDTACFKMLEIVV